MSVQQHQDEQKQAQVHSALPHPQNLALECSAMRSQGKLHLLALPATTVEQNQPLTNVGNIFSISTDNHSRHVLVTPFNNGPSFEHQRQMLTIPPMTVTSINVSTASSLAPKPQNTTVQEGQFSAPKSPSPRNRSNENNAKLVTATAPKLAPRSIISLEDADLSDSTISSSCNSLNNMPENTSPIMAFGHHQQPHQVDNEDPSQFVSQTRRTSQTNRPSYSSACEATLRAQRQLTNRIATIEKAEKNLTIPGTSSLASHGKRASLEQGQDGQPGHKYAKVVGGKPAPSPTLDSNQTLQQYHASLLTSRGYSNQNYCSLEGGYYCQPTDLQKASYGMKLIEAVRTSNEVLLEKLLSSGLSPNPCNAFGESVVHMVCRRGDHKLLKVFLDHGCSVQVSDDFGRTPLHDACWTATPCFKSVEMLLNKDCRLLNVVDCRGSTPLNYVKQENWQEWMQFFDRQKEVWWAHRDINVEGEEAPPALVGKAPHSLPIPDPAMSLSCDDAKGVASGKIDPDDCSERKNCVVTTSPVIDSESTIVSQCVSLAKQ